MRCKICENVCTFYQKMSKNVYTEQTCVNSCTLSPKFTHMCPRCESLAALRDFCTPSRAPAPSAAAAPPASSPFHGRRRRLIMCRGTWKASYEVARSAAAATARACSAAWWVPWRAVDSERGIAQCGRIKLIYLLLDWLFQERNDSDSALNCAACATGLDE